MGKVRPKTKKGSSITHREDGSGEEERLPAKRRGRPAKAQKEEAEKNNENSDSKPEASIENGSKRKKQSSKSEGSTENLKDENGMGPETNGHELTKAAGFRHNGSRRKNKPQRAA